MASPPLRDRPNVLSIPTGVSFAETLAAQLLRQVAGDPLKLAEMTVLLPNRRACRTMQEAFLRQAIKPDRSGASLLPRLMPIGDLDGEDLNVLGGAILGAAAEIPPTIGELKRCMLLARLIMAAQNRAGPRNAAIRLDQAAQLAQELARLLDQVETERKDLSALEGLVPENLARHWQLTIDFLDILRRAWPDILAEEGAIDPADRRNRLLDLQRELWKAAPPATPVIAAGSTGSIPAAADLMHIVAHLPQGAVYLPGLDRAPSEEDWQAIEADPSHPQYGLAQLLKRFELTRADIEDVPVATPTDARRTRAEIVSAALLPADRSSAWKGRAAGLEMVAVAAALSGVQRIDCQSEREEALVIALALRRFIAEHDEGVAALVTPDRRLGRRVAAELKRWRIEIDDSAGQPLAQTAPGAYLLALCEAAESAWAPIPLLGLLKHPLAAGGRPLGVLRALARRLDRGVLRGPRPAPGWDGLRQAVKARDERSDLTDADAAALLTAIRALERATSGMADWDKPLPPAERLRRLIAAAEALAATDTASGIERLWRGEAGEALSSFAHDALLSFAGLPPAEAIDFSALMLELMTAVAVRPRFGKHPRLFIWGPLEARLQQADLLVLGSLNEGTWPAESAIDPWLNRPMRQGFGLPVPERKIGLAAHDFQQAMGAPRVLLTRAERVDGAPTVPSRWLLRLDAFLRCKADGLPSEAHAVERRLAQAIDRSDKVAPCKRPMPRPGAAHRPDKLSVTQIETWRRNPYAIYARHILGLKKLDPLDQDPGAADLGSAVHEALHEFTRKHLEALPADALPQLLAEGEASFREWLDRPNVWAFWQPRFQRIAAWWLERERERRPLLRHIATELKGEFAVPGVSPPFTLTARADRIDVRRDGALVLIDYKTGEPPREAEVALGFSPQLTLEAAMALAGAFPGVAGRQVAEIAYWRLASGGEGGSIKSYDDAMPMAVVALDGLVALIARFGAADACYAATPDPLFAPRFDDYDHLARNAEWSSD